MRELLDYWPVLCGYLFGVLLASPAIQSITGALQKREHLSAAIPELRGTAYAPRVLGLVERTLYIASFLAGESEFVGVWLALKVAGQWNVWSSGVADVSGRTIFSIFLVGSGLSVAYSYIGAKTVGWNLEQEYTLSIAAVGLLLLGTLGLRIYIPFAGRKTQDVQSGE